MDFHIGSVLSAQGDGAVQHEFHIACAAGLLGGQGDLLGDVAGRDQLLRQGHIVVAGHDNIQIGPHIRIPRDDLLQAEDPVDDVLGDHVGRGSLGAEDGRDGCGGLFASLDLQVLADQVEEIHLLALVLVKPLDLNVEDGGGIHGYALGFLQVLGQLLLLLLLDG